MMRKINSGGKGPLAFTRSPLLSLLIALLALLLLYPFFAGSVMARAFWDICSSAVLLLGLYAISHVRRHLVIALVLAIAVLGTKWSGYVIDNARLLLVNYGLGAISFAFTACLLLADVLRKGAVTADKIYGALCVLSPDRPDLGVHVFNTRGVSTRVFPIRAGPVERDRERPRDAGLLQFRDLKYGWLWRYHASLPSRQVICLYGSDHRSNLFGRLGGAVGRAAHCLLDGGRPIIEHILAAAFACASACIQISRTHPTPSGFRPLAGRASENRTP